MLDVDAAVRLVALSYAPLVGVIGDRLVPDEAPQATSYPLIAYSIVGDSREGNLDNDLRGVSGLAETRIQFVSVAKDTQSYRVVKRAHKYLRLALHGYRGTVTSNLSPLQSLFIQKIEFSGGFSDLRSNTEARLVESVVTVYHRESSTE